MCVWWCDSVPQMRINLLWHCSLILLTAQCGASTYYPPSPLLVNMIVNINSGQHAESWHRHSCSREKTTQAPVSMCCIYSMQFQLWEESSLNRNAQAACFPLLKMQRRKRAWMVSQNRAWCHLAALACQRWGWWWTAATRLCLCSVKASETCLGGKSHSLRKYPGLLIIATVCERTAV